VEIGEASYVGQGEQVVEDGDESPGRLARDGDAHCVTLLGANLQPGLARVAVLHHPGDDRAGHAGGPGVGLGRPRRRDQHGVPGWALVEAILRVIARGMAPDAPLRARARRGRLVVWTLGHGLPPSLLTPPGTLGAMSDIPARDSAVVHRPKHPRIVIRV
jgi:hypothetical protein